MRIAAARLRNFEPFSDQIVEFKPRPNPDLAEVHFFVGQNGTGKTRLLSLLAAACGNSVEFTSRSITPSSQVVVSKIDGGIEKFFTPTAHGMASAPGSLSTLWSAIGNHPPGPNPAVTAISTNVAMAFRSIPYIEDQPVTPMGDPKWPSRETFLRFAHHQGESAQLCQALANLKIKMGIVAANPQDRIVRMATAFDNAIKSITSCDLIFTVSWYNGKDFRLVVSWNGKEMQLKQLPDGLRSIVGWLASVLCKLDFLLQESGRPFEEPITLLLDEPDVHLHPAWQRQLIPAVQKMLPNAQIFIATHSPFVISSVNAGWIYIFKTQPDGKVTIQPPIPCGQGDSYIDVVEDVLGITERFDPDTEHLLSQFRSMRDAWKNNPNIQPFNELRAFAEQIAKRSETLQFLIGRELAQLQSQFPSATA